jgi:PAS domain S-box-containing protein
MAQTNSNPRITVFLAIAGFILLGIIAISYTEWREYSRANAAAARTQDTIDALDQVRSSVTDAETAQRGFLLTGENRYLQPYSVAVQAIPGELAALKDRLSARPEESGNLARLNSLVDQRLAALREAVRQRQAQGAVSTSALDDGKRLMDRLRAVCAGIERDEASISRQASQEGEAASATALLTTVVAALGLFFLFSIGQAPAISVGPHRSLRAWPIRYGLAILAAAGAVMLRLALIPLIGPIELGFSIPLAAVLFSAWFGGLGCGAVCTLLSGFGSAYYFTEPVGSLLVNNRNDQISLLIFVVLGFGISVLADSQRRAVERAVRAENAERMERQRFETTLTSIGDAVIATDSQTRVTFANRIALSLLRWPEAEIPGQPLGDVFHIVNEYSRATVESPVDRVLRESRIVGLANHTILIARDGTEVPIDDSAAPIRDPQRIDAGHRAGLSGYFGTALHGSSGPPASFHCRVFRRCDSE